MADTLPRKEGPLAPRETRLSDDLSSYITELTRRAAGTITFRTGSGRILRDLLIHWPTLDGWEMQAQALCGRIVDAIYPLAGVTYAQAMEVNVTISPRMIEPPKRVNALETYAVFDAQTGFERLYYLNPREEMPDPAGMRAAGGVAVVGRPLNVFYHTLKDDRRRYAHIRKGMYELPQSMINALYEEPPFISSDHEKKILASVKHTVEELPQRVLQFERRREAVFAPRRLRSPEAAAMAVPAVTALSALPPPVRATEHRLMSYAMDRELSPEFRLQMRRVAQGLREEYPQAIMTEEARAQLTPRPALGAQPGPQIAPVPGPFPGGPVPGPLAGAALAGGAVAAAPTPATPPTTAAAPTIIPAAPVPSSPGVRARRLAAEEQINQPQLPVDRVDPDRPGASRAGLQPEARPVETPVFAPPPQLPPLPPPDRPELPDIEAPEVRGPRREPRETKVQPEQKMTGLTTGPSPTPERNVPRIPEPRRAFQPEGEGREARLQPALGTGSHPQPEEVLVSVRDVRSAPVPEGPVAPRVGMMAQAVALTPLPRNEDRPRNVYDTLRPGPDAFPRMVPTENSGKLQKTMQAQLTQMPQTQPRLTQKSYTPRLQPWMFPTPSPSPFPRSARLKGK